jgi:hypothetical protein
MGPAAGEALMWIAFPLDDLDENCFPKTPARAVIAPTQQEAIDRCGLRCLAWKMSETGSTFTPEGKS